MLNILKLKLKGYKYHKSYKERTETNENLVGQNRHYPPATKEWSNSIYVFNKNTAKLLPVASKVIINLIKSYFNLYSKKLEKRVGLRRLRLRIKRYSTNRIFFSKAELKHTVDKVIITLYLYNRQKTYFLNRIKKVSRFLNLKYLFKIKNGSKQLDAANLYKINRNIRRLKIKGLNIISEVRKEKKLLIKTLKWNKYNFINYEKNFLKIFFKKSLKKKRLHTYIKQIIYINRSKFEDTYLLPLKSLMYKIYNKKVEFNLINLKYLHLDSNIFSQILAIKLRKRKNRLLRVLNRSLRKVRLPTINKFFLLKDVYTRKQKKQDIYVNDLLFESLYLKNIKQKNDALNLILNNLFYLKVNEDTTNNEVNTLGIVENAIINDIKHKSVNGIRIEASGRLSRRITAARSVFKLKYLGNLKNIESSRKGFSAVILRGHLKSNLQYTKVFSKTRIGSFGLKGWIASL